MLLLSTLFVINTSILSLSLSLSPYLLTFSLPLFIVFQLIKGHTAIFNNLHFYTLKKKKKNYTRKISEAPFHMIRSVPLSLLLCFCLLIWCGSFVNQTKKY